MHRQENFSFGYWLRRQRKACDLKQSELANQLGIATITLRKIEADERRPSLQLARRIADAFDLTPGERTALLAAIRAEVGPDHLDLPERPLAAAIPPHKLPQPANELLGRAADLTAISALLRRPTVRLVTLSGAGGSGKTRLALQVAHDLLPEFPDGVYFVDLAAVVDLELLPEAIAGVLGLPIRGERPNLQWLIAHLHQKRLLLLLDNFEQLIAAASQLATLLGAVPALVLLVTSRMLLRLAAEHTYSVTPLHVPEPSIAPTAEAVMRSSAVQLFVTRACAVHNDFVLDDDNASDVAAICRLLDGLPLAIELAAARVRLLSSKELLARLNEPLAVLTAGVRDLPARQQTMRNTIGWSYNLLSDDERALLRQLAVFSGGFTLAAAESLWLARCSESAAPAAAGTQALVLDLLDALVAHSLVQHEAGNETRFRLPATVREFALEQLVQHGELATAQQQHARYYFDLVLANQQPYTPIDSWLATIVAERANVRIAAQWLRGEVERGATKAGERQLTLSTNVDWLLKSSVDSALIGHFELRNGIDVRLLDQGSRYQDLYTAAKATCTSSQPDADVLNIDIVWLSELAPYLADLGGLDTPAVAGYDQHLIQNIAVAGRIVAAEGLAG